MQQDICRFCGSNSLEIARDLADHLLYKVNCMRGETRQILSTLGETVDEGSELFHCELFERLQREMEHSRDRLPQADEIRRFSAAIVQESARVPRSIPRTCAEGGPPANADTTGDAGPNDESPSECTIPPTDDTASEADEAVFVFVPSGNGYDIEGFDESGHLSSLKGLGHIARLIATPGQAVPMLELMRADDRMKADRKTQQPVFDAEARQGIKEQLRELRADLARAEAENNTAEADSSRGQLEELEGYALQATGLDGKDRNMNSQADPRLRPSTRRRTPWRTSPGCCKAANATSGVNSNWAASPA